jgi:hypothetical protein
LIWGKTGYRFYYMSKMVYNEKAVVDSKFDDVADIASGKDNFCIRVRVVRLWKVPAFLNPSEYSSLEMVLIDEKVCYLFHPVFDFLSREFTSIWWCVLYVF